MSLSYQILSQEPYIKNLIIFQVERNSEVFQ